jgi:hypothetical protein
MWGAFLFLETSDTSFDAVLVTTNGTLGLSDPAIYGNHDCQCLIYIQIENSFISPKTGLNRIDSLWGENIRSNYAL